MRLVQHHGEAVQLPSGVTEGTGPRAIRKPIRDQPSQRLRRGVHTRERRLIVEVSMAELRRHGAQLRSRSTDVDHDAVGVEVRAPERGVDDVRRAVKRLCMPECLAP